MNRKERRAAAKSSVADPGKLWADAQAHHQRGAFDKAVELYRRLMPMGPPHPAILTQLGLALYGLCRWDEASRMFQQALALQPDLAPAHNGLGSCRLECGNPDEAEAAFRTALSYDPGLAVAHSNLALAAFERGRFADAEAEARKALDINPALTAAHNNLGMALYEQCRWSDAEAAFRAAIGLHPNMAEAHRNLGFILLLTGRYTEGWDEHEWRLALPQISLAERTLTQPAWTGQDLAGKRLLLRAEQGMGDMIQFARFVTPLADRGAKVILEAYPPLVRLFGTIPGITQALSTKDKAPAIDYHLPVMSVPRLLETRLDSIPPAPYLSPVPAEVEAWRQRLADLSGVKVGLVWAGNPGMGAKHVRAGGQTVVARRRNIPLSQLRPLLEVPGTSFVCLQMGAPAAEIQELPESLRPLEVTQGDFADTAALMAALDLVITVDTAPVHLAAALGLPTWLMLSYEGEWRHLLEREDSPWYSTLRLFRQPTPRSWEPVVERMASELRKLSRS